MSGIVLTARKKSNRDGKKRKKKNGFSGVSVTYIQLSYIHIVLNIIPTLYDGYIVSVHRMVMGNRPVDPGSIQGSHRPISFIRIKHRTRADDILCKTEY